jgi:hypothetical protein
VISASLFSGSSQIWTTGSVEYLSPTLPITWTISTSSIGNVTYRFIVTASYTSEATNPTAWRTLECGPTPFTITPPANLQIACELTETGFLPTRHNRELDDYSLLAKFSRINNPWGSCTNPTNITLISASLFSGSSKIWETGSINYLNTSLNSLLSIHTLPTQSFGSVTHTLQVTASLSESRFDSTTWARCSSALTFNVSERPCPNPATFVNYNTNFQLGTPPSELDGNIRYMAVELGLSGSIGVTASISNTTQSPWPTNATGYQFRNLSPYTQQYCRDNNTTQNLQRNFNTIVGNQYRYFLNLTDSYSGSLGNTQTSSLNIPIDATQPYNPTLPRATSTNRSYLKILISSSYTSSANSTGVPYFNLNQPPKICNDFVETVNINKTISLRWGVLPAATGNVTDAINQYFTEQSLLDVKRWDIRLGGHTDITGSIFYNLVNWTYSGTGDTTPGYASTSNSNRGKIVYTYNQSNPTLGIVNNQKYYFSGITPYPTNTYGDNLRVFWPDFSGAGSKWLYIIVNENIDLDNSWQSVGTPNKGAWIVTGYTGVVSPFRYYIFQSTQAQVSTSPGMNFNYYLKFY